MNKNKIFILVAVIIALVVFGILTLSNQKSVEASKATTQNDSLLVKPHSPIKGNPDAAVTVVEFLDPECESCRAMHPIMKKLLEEYDGKIKLVIRYMPLHPNSKFASAALEEAREQGRFHEALDLLFEKQPEWGDHHNPRPELISTYLKDLGITGNLDANALIAKHGSKVDVDQADGVKLGVRYTPTFFVNGVELPEIGYEPVKQAIEIALQQ